MSHFTCLVITKPGEDPEVLLKPYDERIEVEPYNQDCYCVVADRRKLVKAQLKREFAALPDACPDPACGECDGKGIIKSTYNPKSKWDWYLLGGRWRGYFKLKEGAAGQIGQAGMDNNEAPSGYADRVRYGDVDWEGMKAEKSSPATFALIAGEWHECGQMGMFGFSNPRLSQEDWHDEWWEIVGRCESDDVLSLYDLHI